MPKTNIEREKIYEIAKAIGIFRYPNMCTAENCTKCDHCGACTPFEMAHGVFGAGYAMGGKRKNEYFCKKYSAKVKPMIENLAKAIACQRGYGCDDNHECSKCVCSATAIGCIPFEIANHLFRIGCEKKVEEQ